MKKFSRLAVVFCIVALPLFAEACPMCRGGGTKQTASAYKSITAMLASLPLVMSGGIFWWLKIQNRKANKQIDE